MVLFVVTACKQREYVVQEDRQEINSELGEKIRHEGIEHYRERLAYYRSRHRTVGCKITHMVGIPIIALSFPALLFNRKLAFQMHSVGWILQFIGHYVFEHNKPVLLETKDPLIVLAALQFCAEEWSRALSGQTLVETRSVPRIRG